MTERVIDPPPPPRPAIAATPAMSKLAKLIDGARADVITEVLADLERQWLLRIESSVASAQSAELTMAQRSLAQAAESERIARDEATKAKRKATVRGAVALGTSSTSLVVIAILGAMWKGASSLYQEARDAVQLYNAQAEALVERSSTNSHRIDMLEMVVGKPETETLPDGRVVLTEPSLIEASRAREVDMRKLLEEISGLRAELAKPASKRKPK